MNHLNTTYLIKYHFIYKTVTTAAVITWLWAMAKNGKGCGVRNKHN